LQQVFWLVLVRHTVFPPVNMGSDTQGMRATVRTHSSGTVPDSHRIPFQSALGQGAELQSGAKILLFF